MSIRLTIVLLCLFARLQSQTLTLYYNINEVKSERNFTRVDSVLSLSNNDGFSVKIYGYADFLSDSTYNLALSLKRAKTIEAYLKNKAVSKRFAILECKAKGEKYSKDNGSTEGEASQRKVEVIFSTNKKEKVVKPEQKEEIKSNTKTKVKPTGNLSADISKVKEGESLELEGLNFIAGRHTLVASGRPILENLLKVLKENPTLKIEIQGHICCIDQVADGYDYDSNDMNLSTNRAKIIYDFLVVNGIDEDRLSYKGYGHQYPKVVEKTEEDEQMNRRVEIKILEK